MAAAFVCYVIGRRSKSARNWFAILTGLVEMICTLCCCALSFRGVCEFSIPGLVSLGLNFEMDGFRMIYASIVAFMWLMTLVFSKEYFAHYHNRNRYYFFNLLTLGATMGVFLSADIYTTFIFFEIMSFTSYVWVIHEEDADSTRAANTYLAVAVIGGLVALMGLFIIFDQLGTLRVSELYSAASAAHDKAPLYIAGGCLLFGFGAKAGMFPLHIWLPKAHPVAPAPASALLSGILTKSGMFGILAVSANIFRYDSAWGTLILSLGVITMVLGAVLALLSINLKRTLACSSMSQIGFILVGVGMMGLLGEENALAARGALLHMVNHSLFKLLLFMVAGVVYMNLHKLDLNDIRGFGRKKPLLNVLYLMGALGIGGIPLWSGYVSKTLLHESIVEYAEVLHSAGNSVFLIKGAEWLFLISGGLTLAYMTKLYVAIFIEKHQTAQDEYDSRTNYMSGLSTAALCCAAAVIPAMGFTPSLTMDRIADLGTDFLFAGELEHAIHYFSPENFKGAAISIIIGAAVYFLIVRKLLMKKGPDGSTVYVNVLPKRLDLEDLVYRPLLLRLLPDAFGWVFRLFGENIITGFFSRWAMKVFLFLSHVVCDAADAVVLILRRTFYRESVTRSDDHYSRSLAYRSGAMLDRAAAAIHHPRKGETFAEEFVRVDETVSNTTRRITGNLSFALLMLSAALCLAFIYLLFMR